MVINEIKIENYDQEKKKKCEFKTVVIFPWNAIDILENFLKWATIWPNDWQIKQTRSL